jgi:hypothetical protein
MVRQALASAEPPGRKQVEHRRAVIGPLRPFIDAILEADWNAPRKQRHTAHRIYQRIRTELPEYPVAEVTVRQIRAGTQTGAGLVAAYDLYPAKLRGWTRKARSIGMKHGRSSMVNE